MALEIERKFLVKADFKPFAVNKVEIVQGYLSSHPERNVRVRLEGNNAFLTIKGIGNATGITRNEWNYAISKKEALELLQICEQPVIEKNRYIVPINGNLNFEIDEFEGVNKGLIIAEIELNSENQKFDKPNWLGKEITGIVKYYNASLIKNPYSNWVK